MVWLLLGGFALLFWLLPWLALLILVIWSLAALLVTGLQIALALRPAPPEPARRRDVRPKAGARPFVSIHLPCHDEPPEIVIATLQALARLDWDGLEVLVCDNNTPDPATWRPVQAACRRLGPRFRFFHVEGLKGAKAGALTLCLRQTDPRSTVIAVIDADYQVEPGFLAAAWAGLEGQGCDFVQFPQAYREVEGRAAAPGLHRELADYFVQFARDANRQQAMLLTGTLSVIRRHALEQAGGWSSATITEDAELGGRLQALGYRGRYLDRVMGRGLLPCDFSGLSRQRFRWVAGNIQTWARLWRGPTGGLRWPGLLVTAQLTAWANFWMLPLVALLTLLPAAALGTTLTPDQADAVLLAAVVVLLTGLGGWLRLLLTLLRRQAAEEKKEVEEAAEGASQAVLARLALSWTSAFGLVSGMLPRALPFVRTPKLPGCGSGRLGLDAAMLGSLGGAVVMLSTLSGGESLGPSAPLVLLAGAMMALPALAARVTDRALQAAALAAGEEHAADVMVR